MSTEPGAVWHTYYQTAERILSLYANCGLGAEAIAYCMQDEGYPFRDRKGNPRIVCRDDVRRVLANWPEYGGIVSFRLTCCIAWHRFGVTGPYVQ